MSSAEAAQRTAPTLATTNPYTVNPFDINVNVHDQHDKQNRQDRQDDSQEAKKNNPQPKPRKSLKDKANRLLIGKDEEEELYEQKYHKRLNWFKNEVRRHVAEFIGTFFLIYFVCGIQINQGLFPNGGVINVDKGLASGLVLIGLIFSFGNVSGAHFNPCVTLAFLLRGAFNFWRFCTYVIVQFAGAVSAAAVLYGLYGMTEHLGTTTPGTTPEGDLENKKVFGTEILLTFLLINTILTTAENANIVGATAGLAVGATFAAIEIWGWNFSGASVNPWRTIAPTMISDYAWSTYWIYIVGPLIGTILAVLVQRLMVTGISRQETKDAGKGAGKNDNKDD